MTQVVPQISIVNALLSSNPVVKTVPFPVATHGGLSGVPYLDPEWLSKQGDLGIGAARVDDVLAGVYEGGLTVWEGAVDLAGFLSNNPTLPSLLPENAPAIPQGSAVLELGAGYALPAVTAAALGAGTIAVQDLNPPAVSLAAPASFALAQSSAPNAPWPSSESITYWAGAWNDFLSAALAVGGGKSFHRILGAEILYRVQDHGILLDIADALLVQEGGAVIIATKHMYFGVGGGILSFENAVKQWNQAHTSSQPWVLTVLHSFGTDGRSNHRHVITLTRGSYDDPQTVAALASALEEDTSSFFE